METKPYSLQSPEAIAKEYAGNKQKIAQAMQMGIVDPTAGVLAGMFIDRMRSAQVQEMAPQPTVAQQVMGGASQAPVPPSSGGLGMTRPAQPSMAPGMTAPPAEMQAVPGMAAGGLYEAPYMKAGGLSEIPLPDTMFDENRDGSYADGGIVAFAEGDEVVVNAPMGRYGFGATFGQNMDLINKYAPQQSKYGDKLTSFYEEIMSPEAQKKRKKEDLWTSLAELGFGMAASKSPTLFGAIGEAGMKAAPGMAARGKERREEQRDAIKTLAAKEDMTNKQAMESFRLAGDLQKAYGGFMDADAQRKLQKEMNDADNKVRMAAAQLSAGAQIRSAQIGAAGQTAYLEKQDALLRKQVGAAAEAQLPQLAKDPTTSVGKAYTAYQMAFKKYGANSKTTADAAAALEAAKVNHVNSAMNRVSGAFMNNPDLMSAEPWKQNWGGGK
jgi:hypothetical protein